MSHGQYPAMQQVAVLLNVTEQAEQAGQALLDELITSGPRAIVASQTLADEETSIGKQPAIAKRVGNTNEESFEIEDSCRSIGTIFTRSLSGPPASHNEAGTTRQLATATAAHVQNNYVNLQNDANGADSLPKTRSCKHDNSTHELDAHTGTAGDSKSVTGNRVSEGSPVQGRPSLSQGRQTPEPNANRPEAARGNGATDLDQVYNPVEVRGEKQLQSEFSDDDLAKRLGRKVLEYQRRQRLLQQAMRTRQGCLSRMEEAEQCILSRQRVLVSMRAQAELLQNKIKEKAENVNGMQGSLGREAAFWRLSSEETPIEKGLALEKQTRKQRIRQQPMTTMQCKVSNQRSTNRQSETSERKTQLSMNDPLCTPSPQEAHTVAGAGQEVSETPSSIADDVTMPPAAAKRVTKPQASKECYASVAEHSPAVEDQPSTVRQMTAEHVSAPGQRTETAQTVDQRSLCQLTADQETATQQISSECVVTPDKENPINDDFYVLSYVQHPVSRRGYLVRKSSSAPPGLPQWSETQSLHVLDDGPDVYRLGKIVNIRLDLRDQQLNSCPPALARIEDMRDLGRDNNDNDKDNGTVFLIAWFNTRHDARRYARDWGCKNLSAWPKGKTHILTTRLQLVDVGVVGRVLGTKERKRLEVGKVHDVLDSRRITEMVKVGWRFREFEAL
ncbi:hypothetical protein B0A49_13788 [Cryomyces minteri]|uniref:Uncharacterized protein n=1 Tax=Cryomyces minteri TaxID=331657 RepID=A0A4U0WE45_9PEZI|nr:hypothetical protein B0A49_13788 [Cryomyces minteri]